MTNYVRRMLNDAVEAGFSFEVWNEGNRDYKGTHAALAEEAITAVEEAQVKIFNLSGELIGTAHIVNGLDEEERISNTDHLDWCDRWTTANVR